MMDDSDDDFAAQFFAAYPSATPLDYIDYKQSQRFIENSLSDVIYPTSLDGVPVPERKWVVEDWIPDNCVTGLYGDGGVGKSLLAMMLLTCTSQGYNWLGLKTSKIRSFGFFCEDSKDELHRRQDDLNIAYGVEFGELQNMAWQSRVGEDNILMSFSGGIGRPTAVYERLCDTIKEYGANFVVIDTAADTFGGNENVRSEVRQYVNLLNKLAMDINGAVVLCAHPSLSGLSSGTGSGGSTAWNNTLRSRLYLKRPDVKDGDEDKEQDNSLRELHKMKSNYSSVGDKITLTWKYGIFSLVGQSVYDKVDMIEINAQNQSDEQLFLLLLSELYLSGRIVSDSKFSRDSYAPRMMITMKNSNGVSYQRLEKAMLRLFDAKKIKIDMAGASTSRHQKMGIVAV